MRPPLPPHLLMAMEADLPCKTRPYQQLAEQYGLTEAELLQALRDGVDNGLIRRYGARLRHQSTGYTANVMVVWQVTEDVIDQAVARMTAHPAISHCYLRPCFQGFPYTLYTMIHGKSREDCEGVIANLAQQTGLTEYEALWTVKEYKKTTPRYSRLLSDT